MNPKILAFAGSTRIESFNKKLVKIAADGAREEGVDVTIIDLKDFQMPLYDADLEKQEGLPPNAVKLKQLMSSHDGLLISSPEYNSSISGVLKNAIDWASRQNNDEVPLACFKEKVAGLMSASPGVLGGLRGLVHVRAILENMGVIVIPTQIAISKAHEEFDLNGNLKDPNKTQQVKNVGFKVSELLLKLHT